MKMFKGFAVLALLAAVFTGCHNGHRGDNKARKMDYAVHFVAGELDFTKEQKDVLKAMKDEVVVKMKEMETEREADKDLLVSQIRSNEVNEQTINAWFDRHQERMERMKPFITEKILEFNALLTDDQRIKLADFIEERHK
jgi:uncharacterized membrane protein